jgi:hypothetical protein
MTFAPSRSSILIGSRKEMPRHDRHRKILDDMVSELERRNDDDRRARHPDSCDRECRRVRWHDDAQPVGDIGTQYRDLRTGVEQKRHGCAVHGGRDDDEIVGDPDPYRASG